MPSILIWLGLIIAAYLLGSVPMSYMAAKRARGIDLRAYGTGQLGGGNLWRLTSWKWGLPVGIFDATKGIWMMWLGQTAGLSVAQQIIIGVAAIAGHNWSIFLKFAGGRGVSTTLGVVLILPLINDVSNIPTITFFSLGIFFLLILRHSDMPALIAVTSLPISSWLAGEPLATTLAFAAVFAILVIGRLVAPRPPDVSVAKGERFLNRLLFDRDIKDRKAWMDRAPPGATSVRPEEKNN
jgi:glycerol-3-phosphate acyltransferase PlsY